MPGRARSGVKISGDVGAGVSVTTAGGDIGSDKKESKDGAPWVRISLAALALASALVGAGVIRGCAELPLEPNARTHG